MLHVLAAGKAPTERAAGLTTMPWQSQSTAPATNAGNDLIMGIINIRFLFDLVVHGAKPLVLVRTSVASGCAVFHASHDLTGETRWKRRD